MDSIKTGELIYRLRTERNMTQKQLANRLQISDKTVSKWERGIGFPDLSMLPALTELFGINAENLLKGELDANEMVGGNMKHMKFYICGECGNFVTATVESEVFCCGKKLKAAELQKAEDDQKLSVELIDNEYYVSSTHEMTKEHYITFVGLLTGDTMLIRKQYPEWDLSTRIPRMAHGRLVWHCNKHGLFYQYL